MTMHLITALMFAPCDVQLWITLKIMFNCVHKQHGSLSHVVRFYGDVVRIHDMWIVLREMERERECMKKSYMCSPYKREQHIQLWHTKQNEMYIGRSEAQKKREKSTQAMVIDLLSARAFLSHISKKKYLEERKISYSMVLITSYVCVCVFVRFSGRRWRAEGRISSLPFLFLIL